MDFFQIDKVRSLIEVDHCYSSLSKRTCDNDDEMFNLLPYHSLLKTEESCLDVGGPASGCSFEEKARQNIFTSVPELCQRVPVEQSTDDNHTWVLCERKYLIQILSSLKKVLRNEYFHNSQFYDIERLNIHKELSLHHAANTLRRIFAELYWHIEKCYSIHLWCVKNLSVTLLSIYRSVFCILWRKNKVNPLLKVLNAALQERCGNDANVYRFLSDFEASINDFIDECNDSMKKTLVQSTSRSVIIKSIPQLSSSRSALNNDNIVLACMTFPASRDSKRLQKLLHLLSEIGHINLECQEEQICDSMRLRLRLFVRRVTNLLDEYKDESIYLVSFGVGSLLMLLSAIHILSLNSRSDNNNHHRINIIDGIICIGIPLVGLRGIRGGLNDPLLSIPSLPILFIVGAKSRFGGYKEAKEFRKKLYNARQSSQLISQNNDLDNSIHESYKDPTNNGYNQFLHTDIQSVESESVGPTFDLLVIGGTDHLLRMRPSACKRWCTTQDRVDIRMMNAIKNFIRKTKMQSCEKLSVDSMLPQGVSTCDGSRRSRFDSIPVTTTRS
ncbi:hypothetical protein MN116_006345 [Schistosoma mekongi]|uniref:Uncharacterized protein n=1 Tax=Schistosoma mekongi TaxID=38744 RepID=A0AAE2D464_SCHME|nr:hypothetical protein MN116_006345 [Schistosoma mekongi]